ncbi:MAG: DUF87 domain-containing protein [Deltaproteobacteria bacterium]|nr:DUF87 domain-containing protein [Deltaproteobacteria bacterium]
MNDDFEKLGVFYLGRHFDLAAGQANTKPVLYKDRDLCTHAVIVGMTGSGKTGLGIALLEEAAIDGIGAIIIDPKGDMGNLALTFPALRAEDFEPWLDEDEARRRGTTAHAWAQSVSTTWREGLSAWGQDAARVARLQAAAEVVIYTPGARFGRGLSVLKSFAAPPAAVVAQPDVMRERIGGAVSGLLALAGIAADPLRSREHILLASILEHAWTQGRDVQLADLIRAVQTPPFAQLGVFDVETVFPAKDRLELAMLLNNLVASPGFSAWTEGDPLDVGSLLQSPSGKPRLSVMSLSHLSDAERMFFVTTLLGEVVAWMRAQAGTSSLRGLLYMDEIFGFFPPNAAPPSKRPMLTLLKQARAFGLGVVLSTQNPVDLDYKGLSNTGTWFVGRLQTERDKLRLLDGLESAVASSGQAFDRAHLDRLLSGLGNRVFLMNNVHDDGPTLFQTRWALSYLRGPMSREQLQRLSPPVATPPAPAPAKPAMAPPQTLAPRPVLPTGVPEFFVASTASRVVYEPHVFASGRVRYASAKLGISELQSFALTVPLTADALPWREALPFDAETQSLQKQPADGCAFLPLPGAALRAATHKTWQKEFIDHLVHERPLVVYRCAALKTNSNAGEDEAAFRARMALAARQWRDEMLSELHGKYADKFARAQDRVRRAEDRVAREEMQADQQGFDAAFSMGAEVLGALMGRRVSPGRVVRSASKRARERQDVEAAAGEREAAQAALAMLNEELTEKMRDVEAKTDVQKLALERVEVRPKKADVSVGVLGILWQARNAGDGSGT